MLGTREPEVYGTETLEQIHARLGIRASELGIGLEARQTNHEGTILDWLGSARKEGFDGILINAGAYSHTSLAIFDALRACALPCVEVHLSNPEAREEYRHRSVIAPACIGKVAGFGGDSYLLGLEGLYRKTRRG
jgi:3-dehydroquinate dehydratase II